MRAELFMVTYGNDYEFAEYTLRSIKKFGFGFAGITIVVPTKDETKFKVLASKYGVNVRSFFEAHGKGFLHHQVVKCEADLWCPRNTDLIVHIDADCVFKEPFSPDTFMHEGKVILVREHFEDFKQYGARYSWKHNVEYALGISVEWETMCRHPSVFYKDMYSRMRARVEERHHYPFTQYVLLQRNEFPQSFAEFPTIGGYAIAFEPERYQMVNQIITPGPFYDNAYFRPFNINPVPRDKNGHPTVKDEVNITLWENADGTHEVRGLISPVQYFWSRKGVTPEYRQQLEAILA
jgi:hypothetical protein